jgi:outer membrane protein TolC
VGTGLQQDVLKAQVELSKILDELIVLRQKKETARARINTLINRLPQSPLPDPGELVMTEFSLTMEELQEMALGSSLPLKAMDQVIASNQAAVGFARKQYYPDFNLSLAYKQREKGDNFEGDDWFSAFVSVNVPLYFKKKQDFGVIEAESNLARAHSKYVEVKNNVFFDLKDTYEEIKKGEERIHLYKEGFLPQARQSLDSAISGYQVDKVDFLTLVDNQLTLLKFELAYYRTLTDYEKELAELEAIVDQRLF